MQSEVENLLNLRLESTQNERKAIADSLDHSENKIKSLLLKLGQKPRETEEEINELVKSIEYGHNTTSQTNADERKFMRELDKLKQKKKAIQEYNSIQQEINDFKSRRSNLQKELRDKERALDDLYQGSRKLKAAARLGCNTSDLLEQKMPCPEDKLSRVIGKSGANTKQIESECNVVIDTDRFGGGLRIIGEEENVIAAQQKILIIINTVTEEFSASDEAMVCLAMGKASLLNQIQNHYGVRIDLNRPKKLCRVTGLPENILGVKNEIASIRCARAEIPFDKSVIPFLLGTKGSTIQALQEEHSVQLDVLRDQNLLLVLGYVDDVNAASAILSDLVNNNKEVEETIEMDRNTMIGCIIGAKGQNIRKLTEELNVRLQTAKSEGGKDGANETFEKLIITGTAALVYPARARILELLSEYESFEIKVPYPDDCTPQLVGKKGAKINALREEHPNVQIDVDNVAGIVRIHSENTEAREAARQAIQAIVDANFSATVHMDGDATISLKGARGKDLRTRLTADLGLNLDIVTESELVRVRGLAENVRQGVELLEEFRQNNFLIEIPCFDEDAQAIFSGTDNLAKTLETKYDVKLSQDRECGTLRIRGRKDVVDEVERQIALILEGGEGSSTKLLEVDAASMGGLIGKGGKNIQKLEAEFKVRLDLLRSKGVVRIRGEAADTRSALEAVTNIIETMRVSAIIPKPRDMPKEAVNKIILRTANIFFGLDMDVLDIEIAIRGPQKIISEAKKYLTEQITDSATCTVELMDQQYLALAEEQELNFRQIRDVHGVGVTMDAEKQAIVITGRTASVMKAKSHVYRMLDFLFTAEFASLPMDSLCLDEACTYVFSHDVFEQTGAKLSVDRPLQCVRIRGSADSVAAALVLIRDAQTHWRKCFASIPIEENTVGMLKRGTVVAALEKDTESSITVDRYGSRVVVRAPNETAVQKAVAAIEDRLVRLQRENWEVVLDDRMFGPMIGKQGAHVTKLRTETGATIDMDARTRTVKVSGPEEKVALAKERILAFLKDMQKEAYSVRLRVPANAFSAIVGTKGATINGIQSSSGVRIDLDRLESLAILRGSEEGCERAILAIKEVIKKDGLDATGVVVVPNVTPPTTEPVILPASTLANSASAGQLVDGEVDAMQEVADRIKADYASKSTLSKSAGRRLRRKNKGGVGDDVADADAGVVPAVSSNGHVNGTSAAPTASAVASPPVPITTVHTPDPLVKAPVVASGPLPVPALSSPVPVPTSTAPAPPAVPELSGKPGELLAMLLGSCPLHTEAPVTARLTSKQVPSAHLQRTSTGPTQDISAVTKLSNVLGLTPNSAVLKTNSSGSDVVGVGNGHSHSKSDATATAASFGSVPTGVSSSSTQYYKSKSGFTVRL